MLIGLGLNVGSRNISSRCSSANQRMLNEQTQLLVPCFYAILKFSIAYVFMRSCVCLDMLLTMVDSETSRIPHYHTIEPFEKNSIIFLKLMNIVSRNARPP